MLGSVQSVTRRGQPALAGPCGDAVDVVAFRLKTGVTASEFGQIGKVVEREQVARQPSFGSRERARSAAVEFHEPRQVSARP
ncbi:MAG: hypothetical protein IPP87_20825 [Ideonella sp.]|nr:hypothetical protein [Ideonella sp.]MBL0150976.1 hypothetical protein [Ideonella sp.]